jgi:uncharacterized Zn finger protein
MIRHTHFNNKIKSRGKEIFEGKLVKNLYELNDKYFAKVKGNEIIYYNVSINKNNNGCNCSCECDDYCKHIYATLLLIQNSDHILNIKTMLNELTRNNCMDIMIELIKDNPFIIQKILKNKERIDENNIYYNILNDIQEEVDNITVDEFEDGFQYEIDINRLYQYDEDLYEMLQIEQDQEQIKLLMNKIEYFINELNTVDIEFKFDKSMNYLKSIFH